MFTRHEIFLREWKRSFREMGGLWCSILAMNVPDLVLFSTFRHANTIKHGRPKPHYNTDTFLTHTTFSKPTYVLPPKKIARPVMYQLVGYPTHIENSSLSKSSNLPGPDSGSLHLILDVCFATMDDLISEMVIILTAPSQCQLQGPLDPKFLFV